MDDVAKLRTEIESLRADIAAHAAALRSTVLGHRAWIVACAVALAAGAAFGRLVS